ncbi:vanadium-dependent haloperoxidase [Emticicia sp. SJ17W-69]|uniref:vanadium-dependent haloperoxidase n=1 Tax=Emticicia sp. SJ17W-69 TaxID=3421657 RepID=UPI003EBC0FA9
MNHFTIFFTKKLNVLFLPLVLGILFSSCKDKKATEEPTPVSVSIPTSEFDASIATRWTDLQLKLIKSTPGYAPPVAARTLAYTSLALYESVVYGMKNNQSLVGQIAGLTDLPKPDLAKDYSWGLAANSALSTLVIEMYATTNDANKAAIDSLRRNIESPLKRDVENQDIIDRSVAFGADIAKAIWEYSKSDGGNEGWNNNFPTDYKIPVGIGLWEPTNAQKTPLLPYWGKNRTFVVLNMTTNPTAPYTFSFKENSDMYKLAKEVYDINKALTTEQKAIANFWSDGANSITPPGHHFNIANIVLKKEKAKLDKAAEVYAKVGMAINDAFVTCWRTKYTYNLMRPQTYIRQAIDPSWSPLLVSPPFPEYSSGHSSGSGAAAEILTTIFGDNFAFTDNTHAGTYADRSFKSFYEYANEATLSRLYGGIHYRQANENGLKNGKEIAKNILKLKFTK